MPTAPDDPCQGQPLCQNNSEPGNQDPAKKEQKPEETIKINTNEANILDFDLHLTGKVKDNYGKEGIPIQGQGGKSLVIK